jgi:hypothetical protein
MATWRTTDEQDAPGPAVLAMSASGWVGQADRSA